MKYISCSRLQKEILNADTGPRTTAISFALGIFLALGPLPGLHIFTGMLLVKIFRLNGIILLLGILIHNPWTMIPIHLLGLVTGDLILHQDIVSLDLFRAFPWEELGINTVFSATFWKAHAVELKPILKPFITGSLVVCTSAGLASYFLTIRLLRKAKKRYDG